MEVSKGGYAHELVSLEGSYNLNLD